MEGNVVKLYGEVALECPECGSKFWIIMVDKVDFECITGFACIDQEDCGYKIEININLKEKAIMETGKDQDAKIMKSRPATGRPPKGVINVSKMDEVLKVADKLVKERQEDDVKDVPGPPATDIQDAYSYGLANMGVSGPTGSITEITGDQHPHAANIENLLARKSPIATAAVTEGTLPITEITDEDSDPDQEENPPDDTSSGLGMILPFSLTISQSSNGVFMISILAGDFGRGNRHYCFVGTTALIGAVWAIFKSPKEFVNNELDLHSTTGVAYPPDGWKMSYDIVISPTHNNGILINVGCIVAVFACVESFLKAFEYYFHRPVILERKYGKMISEINDVFYPQPTCTEKRGPVDPPEHPYPGRVEHIGGGWELSDEC